MPTPTAARAAEPRRSAHLSARHSARPSLGFPAIRLACARTGRGAAGQPSTPDAGEAFDCRVATCCFPKDHRLLAPTSTRPSTHLSTITCLFGPHIHREAAADF